RAAVSTASIVPRTLDRTSRRPRNDHTETTITKRRMGGNDIMNGKTATFCVLLLAAAAVHAQTPIPDQVDAVCTRADLQAAADSYVEAQKSGDISKLALASDAVF